jgi:hypothetical protein
MKINPIIFVVGLALSMQAGICIEQKQPKHTYQIQSRNTVFVEFEASKVNAKFTPACAPGWRCVEVKK